MRLGAVVALALLSACSPGPGANEVPKAMAAHQPREGLTELRKLFAEGHVRAATQADIDAYVRVANAALPAGSRPFDAGSMIPHFTLVLIRPFKVTRQMGKMTARQIIVPVGVGKNDDPNPLFGYYDMATGRCNLPGSNCPGAPKMDAAWHARARRLSGKEPANEALSESERESGDWGTSGKAPPEKTRAPAPLDRLPLEDF